ncbi:MAG: hypothetical protein J7J92_04060 [Candidatus Aenigmarchaeota archaeon]|nr:hypothetical protein [Candidatus Aenigmarchaeota archaeon]
MAMSIKKVKELIADEKKNGYPLDVIENEINRKLKQYSKEIRDGDFSPLMVLLSGGDLVVYRIGHDVGKKEYDKIKEIVKRYGLAVDGLSIKDKKGKEIVHFGGVESIRIDPGYYVDEENNAGKLLEDLGAVFGLKPASQKKEVVP